MKLNMDLDFVLDILRNPKIPGVKTYLKYSPIEKQPICYTKDYGVGMMTWSGDKGWVINWGEPGLSCNIPHVNILIPGVDECTLPSSSSIIAKLDISNEKPPKTEKEVKKLLFKVNEDLFLPEYCDMILKWANEPDKIGASVMGQRSSWRRARLLSSFHDALPMPETKALRKLCELE